MDDERGDEVEDAAEKRRRVPLVPKLGVIAGLWVLVAIVLVGVFDGSGDDGEPTVLGQDGQATEFELEAAAEPDGDGYVASIEGPGGDLRPVPLPVGGSSGAGGGSTTTTTAEGRPAGTAVSPGTPLSPGEEPAAGGATTSTTVTPGSGSTTTTSTPGSSTSTTTKPTTTTSRQPTYSATVNVNRDGNASEFSKSSVSIAAGQSVRFVNKDPSTAHTLRFGDTDEVIALGPGATLVRRFDAPGAVSVTCTVPAHHGAVTVDVA